MEKSNHNILLLVLGFCMLGWIWTGLNYSGSTFLPETICPFRLLTGYPCPACGTTTSVLALLHWKFGLAFHANPLGFIVLPMMLILPFWVIFDWVTNQKNFERFYYWAEKLVSCFAVATALILLIIVNWGWNIWKIYNHV